MRILLFMVMLAGALPARAADIIRYASDEKGFAVNSWLVPTQTGLIVIDTQFTVSEAAKLVKAIEATGRPLEGIVVTHPHPDHYNGTCQLLELAKVPVYATQATIEGIHATAEAKRAQWKPVYGDDYPGRTCPPDHAVPASGKIQIGGLDLEFRDFGAGEASAESIVLTPALQAVFAGDLIYNGVHPWLAEGRSELWLAQLEQLSEELPSGWTLYPGHGPAGGAPSLMAQYDYILDFREAVRTRMTPGLDAGAVRELSAAMRSRHPGWALETLIPMNANAVAREIKDHPQIETHDEGAQTSGTEER